MKTKKVNRYTCDFCAKHKYSAGHMKRHEKNCTKNPNRECACCRFVDGTTKNIKDLISILPNPNDYKDEYGNFADALGLDANEALVGLRAVTNDCPACIMAAIRQAGIPVPVVTDFKYKEELENVMAEYNNELATTDYNYDR